MYVDLHLHLVPGVDDGARDPEDALTMARILVERGWRRAAVTPHIRPGRFDNDPVGVRAAVTALQDRLAEAEVPLEILPGAEHYLDGDLPERLQGDGGLPLGGEGPYVLLEAPLAGPVPGLSELVFRLRLSGVSPVFAHPERCDAFDDLRVAEGVVAGGGVLQLDLGSLDGAYGRTAKKRARRLLDRGLYAVAGTDLHTGPQAERSLDRWLAALERAAGSQGLTRLLSHNPARLLEGKAVHP